MNRKAKNQIERLGLGSLRIAPPQVWGGVRLVPLLRDAPREDLRLSRQLFDEQPDGVLLDRRTAYYSYMPHAINATWTNDGSAVFGTQLSKRDKRRPDIATARMLRRMVRPEKKNSLRFVPLHLAMEGFLAYQFGGPSVAWSEYSRAANSKGLSPRAETSMPSHYISGLADAMRLFEIHDAQVGMLVFVADALASAFVVPHPDDYRYLHETLLTDFYGELLFYYSLYATENTVMPEPIPGEAVDSIDDLRSELESLRSRWGAIHEPMTRALFDVPIKTEDVYRMGPFSMQRFICLLYTSPSPRDLSTSRMPSSA